MRKDIRGFTIVELLIVIVVIAILAAISVVAYNGIQNRASDAALQNDLSAFAKKIRLYEVDNGSFPVAGAIYSGGVSTGASNNFPGFTFSPTKSAYSITTTNLFYCAGLVGSTPTFYIAAQSKSGTAYRYSSTTAGTQSMGVTGVNELNSCPSLADGYSWAYGYNKNTNTWNTWTNG